MLASVSSLDKDLSRLRLAKYTAKDSTEVKEWISEVLGESLPKSRDLMDCLKDGVLLCRLVSLVPGAPQLKAKSSTMPFVQMEQIAAFLNVISQPPISLPAHDSFLTVDLFEKKDPAQVLQCLTAFSRVANRLDPARFPTMVGGKKAGPLSPTLGPSSPSAGAAITGGRRDFNSGSSSVSGYSINSNRTVSSTVSAAPPVFPSTSPPPAVSYNSAVKKSPPPPPAKPSTLPVSSWAKKEDEKKFAPAWNIHQYGYMGGASQGNMGVTFGSRRQIVNTTDVPSTKKKEEVKKKEEEQALGKARWDAARQEELERKKREEERWRRLEEEEARERARETARLSKAQEEAQRRRTWEEEQKALRDREAADQKRQRDEAAQRKLDAEKAERERERQRLRELELELEKARERERQYLREKEERERRAAEEKQPAESERKFLKSAWNDTNKSTLPPLKAHKTGGATPNLSPERNGGFVGTKIATHKTGGTIGLIPQKTGGDAPRGRGLVAQRTGEFNRLPSPSLKTLTPGEYPSSGRISPRPVTPTRNGERRPLPEPTTPLRIQKTGGEPAPVPRALPTPPSKKGPTLPPREPLSNSPTRVPASRYFTAQRTASIASNTSTSTTQTLRHQNSWEHDNETVIDVPIGRDNYEEDREREKEKAYRWANMSFLEKEKERERERQKEWERTQMQKMGIGSPGGGYRSQMYGPRGPRS